MAGEHWAPAFLLTVSVRASSFLWRHQTSPQTDQTDVSVERARRCGANACALLQFLFLAEVLQWRAQTTPDHVLYTLLNCRVSSGTCSPWVLRSPLLPVFLTSSCPVDSCYLFICC